MNLNLSLSYDKKSKIALIIISIIVGTLVTLSYVQWSNLDLEFEEDSLASAVMLVNPEDSLETHSLPESMIMWLGLCFVTGVLLHLAHLFYERTSEHQWTRLDNVLPTLSKKRIAMFVAITFLIWSPYYLAYLPCYMDLDVFYMVSSFYDWNHPIASNYCAETFDLGISDARFADHHPFFDILVMGMFCVPSMAITGDFNTGFTLMKTIQGLIIITELIWCIAFARSKGANNIISFIALLMIICIPMYPMMALNVVKDTTFAIFFIPWIVCITKIILSKGSIFANKLFIIKFLLLAILCCLTKHTGMYIVASTCVIGAIYYRKHWKPFIMQMVICALTMLLILPAIVFPICSVIPGGKQEMLAMPIHQMSTLYLKDKLNDEATNALDDILLLEKLNDTYSVANVDGAKNLFDPTASTKDITGFLYQYIRCGIEYPIEYFNTLLNVNAGYIAPIGRMIVWANDSFYDTNIMKRMAQRTDSNELGDIVMYNYPVSSEIFGWFPQTLYALVNLPVLNVLFSIATWATIVPTLLAWVAWRTKKLNLVMFMPWIVSIGFCIIGPIVDQRYITPILVWIPLVMCLLSIRKTNQNETQSQDTL